MRRNLFSRIAGLLMVVALLASLLCAPAEALAPAESDNRFDNNYGNYAQTIDSYLYENSSGGLTRVDYAGTAGEVVVEDYSPQFQLLERRTIPAELPVWGGFFAGEQYNFLIFGQQNLSESDHAEVVRVVKYDKAWTRLEQASVYGGNTQMPFSAGSLRCAEAGGILYIHTSHTMYRSDDGKNHQSNMNIVVREQDMQVMEMDSGVGGYTGYVSHSFNQFIMATRDGDIVTLDHGDGYPRSFILYRFFDQAGESTFAHSGLDSFGYVKFQEFPGEIGQNDTGAQVGGLVETSTGYLAAYIFAEQPLDPQQLYLAYIPKDGFRRANSGQNHNTTLRQLTNCTSYSDAEIPSCPVLVSTGPSGGYLLWNVTQHVLYGSLSNEQPNKGFRYATYSANGTIGQIHSVQGPELSDCQPIVYNGKVVWYTTHGSAPVFYVLDDSGIKSYSAGESTGGDSSLGISANGAFTDVPADHWAAEAIDKAVESGITTGYADGTFRPSAKVTSAQFCAFVARAFYPGESGTTNTPGDWYVPYAETLREHDVLDGTVMMDEYTGDYGPSVNDPISRYDMAEIMYHIVQSQGRQGPTTAQMEAARADIGDWAAVPVRYQDAVAACYALGLLNGQADGTFGGNNYMTRAQACVVINRLQG